MLLYPFVSCYVCRWEWRKGWDLLLKAYWAEFSSTGGSGSWPVLLRLKTYLPSWEPGPRDLRDWVERHASEYLAGEHAELPPVELVTDDLSRESLRTMYAAADAFVLPTRGEGWGLPIAEAMSMGLPVIVRPSPCM